MEIPILFEDDSMIVINKPPGVVVNRAESVKMETVQDWVEEKLLVVSGKLLEKHELTTNNSQLITEFLSRSGIVHRIDKETSGILLIAKTPEAFFALKQQFMDRTIQKIYLAIIHGRMPAPEGEINAPVGRLPWNRERFGVVPDGKEAVTKYRQISVFSLQFSANGLPVYQKADELKTENLESENRKQKIEYREFSLLELNPKTGRTHQIRVHLKYSNHPIVGDYLYAGRKTSRSDREWAPRVMLHAAKITFSHPTTQQSMTLEAEIPEDMSRMMGEWVNT